ncbi:glycoside hydrolase family 5 protein [Deinococcus ruber]|uniref:Glycoside hydrolase family 5 domain-containing protein n=1 Tax=Deinococcus ruber TaxID=1848197 RepID=A0A918FBN2_9DEIO|nr:cellulase family glycosylhydrolase [Deinococcus ruber]GGR28281.1 hypothetical protein GCM10008957_44400 [Deinococcus ruber]
MLQVRNGIITDEHRQPVQWRGTCTGGWLHLENFINGYPGAEHVLKRSMRDTLGPEKTDLFFDRMQHHFFSDDDLAFLKSLGSTVVRIPLNYRSFENDLRPFELLEDGFARVQRAVEMCARHGLYAILDLHAVQGWQNTDWHSDNASRNTLFWQHAHFQERFIHLWTALAERFRGNKWVAAYNIMNEPVSNAPDGRFGSNTYSPDWGVMNSVYRRAVAAIREVDPDHIIVLEGDLFSTRFSGLDAPFAENLVYSSHNYSAAGFGPGAYPGMFQGFEGSFAAQVTQQEWNRELQREIFAAQEGTRFTQQHNVPLWIGEFGSVYNGPGDDLASRLRAIDDQISVFEEFGAHWTTWTYKDVGVMGLVTLDPNSSYIRRVAPSLQLKAQLDTDFWMGWLPTTPAKAKLSELAAIIEDTLQDPSIEPGPNRRFLGQATFDHYVGHLLINPYVQLFQGLSDAEIETVMASFEFKNCIVNTGLAEVLSKHMRQPHITERGSAPSLPG